MEEGTRRAEPGQGEHSKKLKLGLGLLAVLATVALAVSQSVSKSVASREDVAQTADAAGSLESEMQVRSLAELRADLASATASVRAQAVVDLTQQGARELVPELRRALQTDSSALVRGAAAVALGSFQDTESTMNIAALLKGDKEISPDVLLDALTRMKDVRAARFVTPFLNSDHDVLRLQAVEALVVMRADSQAGEILRLARANKDVEKAKNFAVALGKLKVSGGEDYLIRLAQETPPSPTLAASYLALGRIESKKAVPLLASAIGKDFLKGRENAIEALLTIRSTDALPLMYPYLGHADSTIRFGAAEVLAQIPHESSGPRLLEVLGGKERNAIGPAAYALGRLKFVQARSRLEAVLGDKSSPDREVVARAFGWMGGKESTPLLIATLREGDGEGRYGAAWSLGVLEATEAIEDLKLAADSRDRKLAALSIEALGMMRSEKSLSFLADKTERDPDFAAFSLTAIAIVPGTQARLTLEKFARHKDPRIAKPALQAIAQRKEQESIPALVGMIDASRDPENRKLIYFALSSITGKRLTTGSEWQAWYRKNGAR